jgi:anti-anti-sigma factor
MMDERRTATGWLIMAPSGRLDAHTAPAAERELAARATDGVRLAIDLAGVDYLSSAGLRILLATLKLAQARGGQVALLGARENVKEVLDVSGFTSIFQLPADERELT